MLDYLQGNLRAINPTSEESPLNIESKDMAKRNRGSNRGMGESRPSRSASGPEGSRVGEEEDSDRTIPAGRARPDAGGHGETARALAGSEDWQSQTPASPDACLPPGSDTENMLSDETSSDPNLVAYEAGRLLNCLKYHVFQRSLGLPWSASRAERIADKLSRGGRILRKTLKGRDEIQRSIKDVGMTPACFFSEEYFDSIYHWLGCRNNEPDLDFPGNNEPPIEELFASDQRMFETFEDALTSDLDLSQQLAFRLGRLLDQAIRPDNYEFHCSLFDNYSNSFNKYLYYNNNCSDLRDDPFATEIALSSDWFKDLRQLAREIGIAIPGTPVTGAESGSRPVDCRALVRELDQLIRAALTHIPPGGSPEPVKSQGPIEESQPQRGAPSILPARREGTATEDVTFPEPITAAEYERLLETKRRVDPDGEYIGSSPAILRVFEMIELLNRPLKGQRFPEKPVLIIGPSGAGKTKIAILIHRHSQRPGPYRYETASDHKSEDHNIIK